MGDEGGFAPDLPSSEDAIEAVLEAAERAGHRDRIAIALDPAASEIFRDGIYRFEGSEARRRDRMVAYWEQLVERFPIASLEDPLAEDEWDSWRELTSRAGDTVQLVGDDLFVTNPERLKRGIDVGRRQRDPVKVNQIGTLTETLDTIRMAHEAGYATVISHRSGETEDTTIADLAVATGAGQIKTGAPSRTDRVAKYNRLLRIEEELGGEAAFPGWDAFPRFRTLVFAPWRGSSPAGRRSSRRSGPRRPTRTTLEALVEAGTNALRLNFSHGQHEDHAERRAHGPRDRGASGWRTLALIADLQGPKLRVTELPEPLTVAKDQQVLVAGADGARDGAIPVAPSVIGDVLQPGHDILIDDGHIRLRVDARRARAGARHGRSSAGRSRRTRA